MANVTLKVTPGWTATQTPASGFLAGTTLQIPEILSVALTNGTAANQIDLIYAGTISLASSTPQTLDLTSLTDVLGGAVALARVKLIAIKNKSTTDGQNVTAGNAASNAWSAMLGSTGTITILPGTSTNPDGGWFINSAPNTTGWPVDSTHKNLKLDPGSASISVDVVIAGASA